MPEEMIESFIKGRYDVDSFEVSLLASGVSDVYLIHSDKVKLIFKLHRVLQRTFEELEAEIILLNQLKDKESKVSYPVADTNGNWIQSIEAEEGIRYGIMYTYAPGKVIYDLSEEQLTIVGREIAFNHNVISNLDLDLNRQVYDVKTTLIEPFQILEPAFAEYRHESGLNLVKKITDKVINHLDKTITNDFGHGYCHYDCLPKNFHFDENNGFTLFDFDFFGSGLLVNDLMTLKTHYFFHMLYKGMSPRDANSLFNRAIEGYRERRDLAAEEVALIPYLGHMFWLFYLNVQYQGRDGFSKAHFNQEFFIKWIGWIEKWDQLFIQE